MATEANVTTAPNPHAAPTPQTRGAGAGVLVLLLLVGAAVSLGLGVYGRSHTPTGRPVSTLGFPTLLDMKVGLTTAAGCFAIVQVVTALGMYGRLGKRWNSKRVALAHRVSGVIAVLLTVPVAFHCLWSLGFGSYSNRVLAHSVLGCLFYGVFVTKMLALQSKRVPGWAIPVLGGAVFTVLVLIWLTSALWFFATQPSNY